MDVPVIEDKPNMLHSTDFYKYLEDSNIDLPYQKFLKSHGKSRATVLIGVSGAGKTATCVALGRQLNCIYFDCFSDEDFAYYIELVLQKADTEHDGSKLKVYAIDLLLILIQIRWRLLIRLLKSTLPSDDLKSRKIFSFQRTQNFQAKFQEIFAQVLVLMDHTRCDLVTIDLDADGLLLNKIILDEAHILIKCLENRFPDSEGNANCQSLYAAVVRGLYRSCSDFILCGTCLRMKDYSTVVTAAGGGKEGVSIGVFNDFSFYTPYIIREILERALKREIFENIDRNLIDLACQMLQGRVWFPAAFLLRLYEATKDIGEDDIGAMFEKTAWEYFEDCTTKQTSNQVVSLYNFWEKNFNSLVTVYGIDNEETIRKAGDLLVEMALDYLIQSSSNYKRHFMQTALVRLHKNRYDRFSYSIAEPLAIIAGLKYMKTRDKHPILEHCMKEISETLSENDDQSIGKLVELFLAIRCTQHWWSGMDSWPNEIKSLFPDWVLDALRRLKPAQLIYRQSNQKENGCDWTVRNFNSHQSYMFVMPDNMFGPDGVYNFMCFNLKTSQNDYVSSEECKSNMSKTNLKNWCSGHSERLKCVLGTIAKQSTWPGFVHFLIELPQSNPNDDRKFENDDKSTTILVNLDSPIALLIFGQEFVETWKRFK